MFRTPRKEKGQALVEIALSLPFLLLLLAGIIEFGFILWAYVQVSNSSRVGARAGSLYDPSSPLTCVETVSQAVGGNGEEGGELPAVWGVSINVTPNCESDNLQVGEQIGVTVGYDFPLPVVTGLPIIGDIIGPTFHMERQVIMRVQ